MTALFAEAGHRVKLIEAAQGWWRTANAFNLSPLVSAGERPSPCRRRLTNLGQAQLK
jgi:hypothetical protein